jgi:hypothetical protein
MPRVPTFSAMMGRGPPQIPELRQLSLRQAVLAAVAQIDPPDVKSADR